MGTLKTGRLVEAIMKYRGMNVDDLAKAMSWHPMNVYKLLNGKKRITDELAIKIAKILDCSPLVIMVSRNIEMAKVE